MKKKKTIKLEDFGIKQEELDIDFGNMSLEEKFSYVDSRLERLVTLITILEFGLCGDFEIENSQLSSLSNVILDYIKEARDKFLKLETDVVGL